MEDNIFLLTELPASTEDVATLEARHHFLLPDDYRSHLLSTNGGFPKKRTFLKPDEEGQPVAYTLNKFYSVGTGSMTVEESLRLAGGDLHDDLVPFSNEAGGDFFCLSVGPEDYGSVYYISHEFYKPPKRKERKQPRQYGKGVTLLSASFSEFMNALVRVEDEDEDD